MTQFERIGRFQVLDRIGGDAFSLLYSGRDLFAERPVEIRVCVAADEEFQRSFLHAAEECAPLRHRNISRVLEFGSGEAKPYLVQEVFPGSSLKEEIYSQEPPEDVVKLFYLLQIGQGLQYAHDHGVIHQELNPGVVRVGEGERVKISDFGIARLASSWIQVRGGGAVCPSAGYLLPEVLAGLAPDQRSEVFGFGATAYEMLTSRPPFPAETFPGLVDKVLNETPTPITSLWPECPEELEAVIHKCLSLDPQRRYPGMDETLEDLSAVLPIPAEPVEEISHERQQVREESQTIYIVDQDSLAESEPPAGGAPPGQDLATGEVRAGILAGRWVAIRRTVGRARQALPALGELSSRLAALHWRSWPAAAALLLLFVVAGWGLANRTKAEPAPVSSVVVSPTPAAREEIGLVSLDAQPWAMVSRILDERGDEVPLNTSGATPMTLQLPAGHYRVELTHPSADETRECRVKVTPSRKADCRLRFASVDTEDYFRMSGWWR